MAMYCIVTMDHNGGSATPASGSTPATPDVLYVDGEAGGVYLSYDSASGEFGDEAPNPITIPTWAGHTFRGYYDQLSGGQAYISANGYIVASVFAAIDPATTPTLTLYAHWVENFFRITINQQGGTGGTVRLYYDKANRGLYTTTALTTRATEIALPTRECFAISNGFYSEPNGAGTKLINANGTIPSATQSMEFTGDTTIYANWKRISYKVTLDWNGGKNNDAGDARTALFFRVATGGDLPADRIYGDDQCRTLVTGFSTRLPQRAGYSFSGYRANADGSGTLYVNSNGQVQDALKQPSTAFSADFTIYAAWTLNSYIIKLVKQGGTNGTNRLFNKLNTAEVYTNVALTLAYSSSKPISTPERTGYSFDGYWRKANKQGNQYIDDEGKPYPGNSGPIFAQLSKDISLYAGWTANNYVLTFDPNGGTIPGQQTDEVSVQVTYGTAIGNVFPSNPRRDGFMFDGWYVGSKKLATTTKYKWAANKTATARWLTVFGNVVDYFGLCTAGWQYVGGKWIYNLNGSKLVLLASNSGDTRSRDAFRAYGKTVNGVATGATLRNPSVTYGVVDDLDIGLTLGTSYGDYMLTGVEVSTAAGERPTITLTGTANEGANAVNLFQINNIVVSPRSKAQNLMSAIGYDSNSSKLVRCSMRATCEPVIVFAPVNGTVTPVASDVVNGIVEVAADVMQTSQGNAPWANSGAGFALVGLDNKNGEASYIQYGVTARKELQ